MTQRIRMLLALAAVGLVAGVALVAAVLNPPGTRSWLVVCAALAAAMAVQAVSSEPRDLIPALLFALIPVIGLASEGSPWWLGPPFAALLLIAGELSALTWEGPVRMSEDGSFTTRLWEAGIVGGLGLGVAVVLGAFGATSLTGGTWSVLLGSAGLVAVASVVFPRGSDGRQTEAHSPFE